MENVIIRNESDLYAVEDKFLKENNFVEDFGMDFFYRHFLISKDKRFYCTPTLEDLTFRIEKLANIVDVSLSVNNSILQGIQDTLIGGALFGAAGALAYGGRAGKVSDLHVDVILKNTDDAHMRIDIISSPIKIKSNEYSIATLAAEKIYAKLKASIKQEDSRTEMSATEEIRKYKALADDGIITQEEFEAKKKQLLGI